MKYLVTDIQRFCMHDGPGVRTTVFLKGCSLNCFWCHNPESKRHIPQLMYHEAKCIGCGACFACPSGVHVQKGESHAVDFQKCSACGKCVEACPTGALQMAGRWMSGEEIIEVALKDKAFYGKEGGITLSGGEPMLHSEKCIALLRLAKQNGLHTAVETCGYFPKEYIEPLCKVTDLFLWDIKDTNNTRHKKNTGVSNQPIIENLKSADTFNIPIILRCILLKGINSNDEHLSNVKELFLSLKNGVRIDLLPCHSLGGSKCQAIGERVYELARFEVSEAELSAAKKKIFL